MNHNGKKLSTTVVALALSGISLTACGSASKHAADAHSAANKVAATQSATTKNDNVSRDQQRSPLNTPSSTTQAQVTVALTYHNDKPIMVQVKENTTVAEALKQAGKTLGKNDTVTPGKDTKITKNTKEIKVTSKDEITTVETKTLAQPKNVYIKDAKMPKTASKTLINGHPGEQQITYKIEKVNGKQTSKKQVDSETVTQAVPTQIVQGTKDPTPQPASTQSSSSNSNSNSSSNTSNASSSSTSSSSNTGAAAPAMANEAMWDKIAACESGNNWSINTHNGYFGGLQFNHDAWAEYGGHVYAPEANLATKAQQIDIANKLYAARGLEPWQCGWAASR